MKKQIILALIIAVLILTSIAYYLLSPLWKVVELDEKFPLNNSEVLENVLLVGNFAPSAHEVSGKVVVIESNGTKILRFKDFETVNGPDLHIYLSSDLEADDYIDLGAIKATKGNVNYDVPEDVNLEKYNKVLIWCVPFRVLFSYSELEEIKS